MIRALTRFIDRLNVAIGKAVSFLIWAELLPEIRTVTEATI